MLINGELLFRIPWTSAPKFVNAAFVGAGTPGWNPAKVRPTVAALAPIRVFSAEPVAACVAFKASTLSLTWAGDVLAASA
jgi:hypothetical protein